MPSLRQLSLDPPGGRAKRDTSKAGAAPSDKGTRPPRRYPAAANAEKADAKLQKNLIQWLKTGSETGNTVPAKSSIAPFIERYTQALNEPTLQAWFKAQALKPSTVRVFSDCVTGIVVRDGKEIFQRLSTTDGSGWGLVGKHISAAQRVLSPDDRGIPINAGATHSLIPREVILSFYGVKPPANEQSAPQLAKQLKQQGWPEISSAQRDTWGSQFKRLLQQQADSAVRAQILEQLRPLLEGKPDSEALRLQQQSMVVEPGSTLDRRSIKPRKLFVEFLASAPFQAFLKKTGFAEPGRQFRLSAGDLQMRNGAGQWVSLQRAFDDEVGKVGVAGSADEKAAASKMNEDLAQLVKLSKKTGNALYTTRTYDARQVLKLYLPDAVKTVGQLRVALEWLDIQLPSPPLAGDYAAMTPYVHSTQALSGKALETLKGASGPVMALFKNFTAKASGFESFTDPDSQFAAFFDSPQAIAQAESLARSLQLYAVADGQTLAKADRHQLLAAALKLNVDATLPGKPGTVAGYGLYQPGNKGRTLKEVRSDVEKHLQGKGLDASVSSLMAHLFLAQSAPEMLIKKDPTVPADTAQLLNQDPESIKVGSTGWLNLRLGCALVDSFATAGSSRAMNFKQIMALARLSATGPEQETLIKQLAAQPLLDWAVMAGVLPASLDGNYSADNYETAAKAFTERENQTQKAFATLVSGSPTQADLLVKELVRLLPEMTEDEIRNIKLQKEDYVDGGALGNQYETYLGRPETLTDAILMNQAESDSQPGLSEDWVRALNLKIPFATLKERLERLPRIAPLVAPAVDRYIAEARTAQATVLKQMIDQLPLQDRKALAAGKIEFFSVRKETGEDLEADRGAESSVATKMGRHGLLMRYETGAVEPRYGYFEVFPGSMKMVKRTDLPEQLPLGGNIENGKKPFGPFAYVNAKFRRGTELPFDFEAYHTSDAPRPGMKSKVIIERLGSALPEAPSISPEHTPDTFASSRTAQIVERLQAHSFVDDREARIAYANEPSALHKRERPLATSKLFTTENARALLSLIPYVGAIADLVEGKTEAGVKGLLIDLASLAATGGLSAFKGVAKGLRMFIPFSGKPFSMAGLKGAGAFFRGLFNPLDSVPEILRSAPNGLNALKMIAKGQTVRVGSNIFLPVKTFEQWRWALGARDTLLAGEGRSPSQWPGARMGASADREVLAVQKNGAWYAINPLSGKPEGAPLERFTPEAGEM
ncbi:hypothetical protein ACW9IF_02120 [Pseudomonas tolaasii]